MEIKRVEIRERLTTVYESVCCIVCVGIVIVCKRTQRLVGVHGQINCISHGVQTVKTVNLLEKKKKDICDSRGLITTRQHDLLRVCPCTFSCGLR